MLLFISIAWLVASALLLIVGIAGHMPMIVSIAVDASKFFLGLAVFAVTVTAVRTWRKI